MRRGAWLFALAGLAACARGGATPARGADGFPEYAVLTELGTRNLPMQRGSNVRVMKLAKISRPELIAYDTSSGVLTLRNGVFEHVERHQST